MPRKSAHSAVQRGGTIDNETKSRRSTRSSMRHDSSGSLSTRTRRSSATSQTHVSLTESRVTRSRNTSSRNRSSSPSENTRTRSSREISLESPASRVKTTRRSTGRVNYQESEGEEDMTSTTEKNEEEEYHVEDDLEESDSEESNRSRTRSRTATKSPPKVRGRGRGRPPKTTKGKSWYASTEENDDDEDDDEDDDDDDSDEKNLEESDNIDEITITRRNNKLENESESIRKTRGTKRKLEKEPPSMRSTRSGKTIKDNTEIEKVHLSATVRQTRSRKMSSEANVSIEDIEMKKENSKNDDILEEMEIMEEKRKRKVDTKNEAKKRFKSDESTLGNEIIKNEIEEKHEKSESLQQNTKFQQSDDKDLDKSQTDKEILPEICKANKNELVSTDKTNIELSDKTSNVDDTETLDLSALKEKTFIEVTEKSSEQISIQKDDIKEVDNDSERKTNAEVFSTKTDISTEENNNNAGVDITKLENISEPMDQEIKDYSITTITQKENKSELCIMDTDSQKNIFQANNDHKNDALSNSKVSSSALTSLTNTMDIEDSDSKQSETEKCQEQLLSTKESTTIETDILPLEPSNSQDSSKHIEEPSNVQEINLKDTENNSSHWNENKSNSSSCGILQSTKAVYSEKNITAEVLSVNGANICTEKSSSSNKNGDIIDMSKVSDNSASETENLSVEPFLQAPTHIECLTKANGAPNDSLDSSNLGCTDLPNRNYVYNSSLSEDSKSCLKSKMFSLVSYNLSAMSNESSSQNEKLLTELKRTNADFICLQEIPKIYYDILESDLNVLGYKGVISVPENKTRGLGTFYKTSSFNLKRQTGVSLQKIIDQDLETSSLENADKVAIRNFLQKCGHTLMVHFSSVSNDCTLTIANVFFPPSDISTHALQMSSLVREVINFAADIARPHILCGSFNMIEGSVAYQLLREGYLNNEMIEELQKRKDVALPGKDNDTLVNLLWKAFQHPSSNLRSCYATVLGHELHLDKEDSITSPDLLWYSSDSLETIGVLDVIPIDKKNIGPVTLKADIAYIC